MTKTMTQPTPEQQSEKLLSREPMETPDDLQTEERTASDKEVFDAIIGKHKTDQPDETPQPKGQAPQTEEPEAKAEEPSEPSPDVAAAKQFLTLKTRVPQRLIDSATDAELLEWAEERRVRETTVDEAFARAKRAEKETQPSQDEEQPTAEEELNEPTLEAEPFIDDELAEDLALTDEGRARLDKKFQDRFEAQEKRLQALEGREAQAEQQANIDLVQKVRQQVGERFSGLADDDTFVKVLADAAALEETPEFAGSGRSPEEYLPELFERAARGRGLEASMSAEEAAAAREAAEREQDRRDRVDSAAGPVSTQPGAPKDGDSDWEVYKRIRGL